MKFLELRALANWIRSQAVAPYSSAAAAGSSYKITLDWPACWLLYVYSVADPLLKDAVIVETICWELPPTILNVPKASPSEVTTNHMKTSPVWYLADHGLSLLPDRLHAATWSGPIVSSRAYRRACLALSWMESDPTVALSRIHSQKG